MAGGFICNKFLQARKKDWDWKAIKVGSETDAWQLSIYNILLMWDNKPDFFSLIPTVL